MRRTYFVNSVVIILYELKNRFIDGTLGCNTQCRLMQLGSLTMAMHKMGLAAVDIDADRCNLGDIA